MLVLPLYSNEGLMVFNLPLSIIIYKLYTDAAHTSYIYYIYYYIYYVSSEDMFGFVFWNQTLTTELSVQENMQGSHWSID
jgi:hypothetical protein